MSAGSFGDAILSIFRVADICKAGARMHRKLAESMEAEEKLIRQAGADALAAKAQLDDRGVAPTHHTPRPGPTARAI